jgi:hypothetical protein
MKYTENEKISEYNEINYNSEGKRRIRNGAMDYGAAK